MPLIIHPSIHLCPSINLSVHVFIQLPIHPCITHPSPHPFTHPLTHPFIHHLSICLLIPLSIHPRMYLVHHPSIFMSTDACTHPSIDSSPIPQSTHSPIRPLSSHLSLVLPSNPPCSAPCLVRKSSTRNENRSRPCPRPLASHLFPVSLHNRVAGLAFPAHLGTLSWQAGTCFSNCQAS